MGNDSSLGTAVVPSTFDLETQKGVMGLLAAVRVSEITSEQKNELRDLVFLYTNGGRDESVRISLQQKIVALGIQPVIPPPASVTPEPKPQSRLGASRLVPNFSVSVTSPPAQSAPQPASQPQPQPAAQSVPQPEPVVAEVPTLDPVSEPVPASPPVSVAEPAPTSPSVVVPEPLPVSPPVPESVLEPDDYNQEVALQRIREIKALVNDKVGNPVNLVDIDNSVGREYMAALLDAMKRISSGASVVSAMKRLEEAYQNVERTIEEHQVELDGIKKDNLSAVVQESPAAPTPQPQSIPVMPEQENKVVPQEPPAPQPTQTPITPTPAAEPMPMPDSVPVVSPLATPASVPTTPPASTPPPISAQPPENPTEPVDHTPQADTFNKEPVLEQPTAPQPPSAPTAYVSANVPVASKPPSGKIESAWGPATDTLRPKVETRRPVAPIASLADVKEKLRTPAELPSAADVSSVAGDALFTQEVDNGLQQLLMEWSLFKKSGLFGTGPNGSAHPLFKKIAGLQIPLLLAGRFEGATQEIKQSITDYMNGWRYEQGIIYEQGETFEHYLRRVIRHILDLQKQK